MLLRRMTLILAPLIAAVLLLLGPISGAVVAQDATPEATPVSAESAGTPIAKQARIVTLVLWYQPDAKGENLQVGPLLTNAQLQAGPGDPAGKSTGVADFDSPDNVDDAGNELPRIVLGDSVFDAYAVYPDDPSSVSRWTYFDDNSGVRPATLVMQIEAIEGPYKDLVGTATWISRGDSGTGVLVIVLREAEAAE